MDISVIVAVASLHLNGVNTNPNGYNQINPGVALEVDKVAVGVYRNSVDRTSVFGVYSPFSGWVRPFLGAVSGYRMPVMPALGVEIEPWHKYGPVITITPMNAGGGFVYAFGWKQSL